MRATLASATNELATVYDSGLSHDISNGFYTTRYIGFAKHSRFLP